MCQRNKIIVVLVPLGDEGLFSLRELPNSVSSLGLSLTHPDPPGPVGTVVGDSRRAKRPVIRCTVGERTLDHGPQAGDEGLPPPHFQP